MKSNKIFAVWNKSKSVNKKHSLVNHIKYKKTELKKRQENVKEEMKRTLNSFSFVAQFTLFDDEIFGVAIDEKQKEISESANSV